MFNVFIPKSKLEDIKVETLGIPKDSDIFHMGVGLKSDYLTKYLIFQPGIQTYGHIFSYDKVKDVLMVSILNSKKDILSWFKNFQAPKDEIEFKVWEMSYTDFIPPFSVWLLDRNGLVMNKIFGGNVSFLDLRDKTIKEEELKYQKIELKYKKKLVKDFFKESFFEKIVKDLNKKYILEEGKELYFELDIHLQLKENKEIENRYREYSIDDLKIFDIYFEEILTKLFRSLLSFYLSESKMFFKNITISYETPWTKERQKDVSLENSKTNIVNLYVEDQLNNVNFKQTPYIAYSLIFPTSLFLLQTKAHASTFLGLLKHGAGVDIDSLNIFQPSFPCGISLWEDYYCMPVWYNKIDYDRETTKVKLQEVNPIVKLEYKEILKTIEKYLKLKKNPLENINNRIIMDRFSK